MSYTLPLPCGCTAYVSCWPDTGVAHTRVIEFRGASCRVRTHDRGRRVYLWDLLPQPTAQADFAVPEATDRPAHEALTS